MNTCPDCQDTQKQVKAGFNRSGSQRYRCKISMRRYTPQPARLYGDDMRQQALRWYVDGASYRWIARHLGVDHVTVMNWVKAHADQLPPAPTPAEESLHIVEMDELHTFVGRKTQMVHKHSRRAGRVTVALLALW